MSNFTKKGDYKFSIKLYPDCKEYNCQLVLTKLCTFFTEWLWICHDKDIDLPDDIESFFRCETTLPDLPKMVCYKKAHIHFYGLNNHNCNTSLSSLIKYLCIPYKYAENGDFEYANKWESCVLYSIHRNAPDKHQYSLNELHTNIYDIDKYFRKFPSMEFQANSLISFLDECKQNGDVVNLIDLCKYCSLNNFNIHIVKTYFLTQLLRSYNYEI